MTDFTLGQVVRVRRSEADKYQRGWYVCEAPGGEHIVHIEGAGEQIIKDCNIQAHPDNIALTGAGFVFRTPAGNYSVFINSRLQEAQYADVEVKNLFGNELVAILDLKKLGISFAEGAGMLPVKKTIYQRLH